MLDLTGLLLFSLLFVGGGLYLFSRKTTKKKSTLPAVTKNDQETAEELFPKFQFPPEIEHEQVPELSLGYNDTKITIMARDPGWIYAYWETNEETKKFLHHSHEAKWDGSYPVLRVYDVTDAKAFNGFNANSYYDTIVNDVVGCWYLHVGVPNRTYCVDHGRILNDGTYVVIARSNYTYTPRNTFSDKTDPELMLISENERKLYNRIGNLEGIGSSDLYKKH